MFSVMLPAFQGEWAVFQERPLVPYKVSQTLATEGSVFFFFSLIFDISWMGIFAKSNRNESLVK